MNEKVRSCDKFGTPLSLKYNSETEYKSLAGGIVSICLKALILTFFCFFVFAVYNHSDPIISSYEVRENRLTMDEMNLGDMKVRFYFCFCNQ